MYVTARMMKAFFLFYHHHVIVQSKLRVMNNVERDYYSNLCHMRMIGESITPL